MTETTHTAAGEVADVLAAHQPSAFSPGDCACSCDWAWRKHDDYRAHVAAAITAALAAEAEKGGA